ncbi:hypothetical protein EZE20_20175 [Arundinibacter roseus]|uniref:General stress protein 17M-like domain-containing protein n=2 Tax=Arundinibacter roseus TaxID=2070510 RepID=A0A4R4K1K5_9BACT|nr:hypothetical protein EZE20_20175 [Arundinibacter roseus]
MITAVFLNRENAEKAYDNLLGRGYTRDDISVMMSKETRDTNFGEDNENDTVKDSALGDKAMEGAGVGSAIGGTAGAIIGAIAAIGTSVALPGLGLVIAGPIVAGLTGAGAGGLTGGIIGALVGSGIPEERAKHYKTSLEDGGILVGVRPRSAEESRAIAEEWKLYGGQNIHTDWNHDTWDETRPTTY